jgi:hypothetical protein
MRLLIAAAALVGVSMLPHAAVAGEPQFAQPQAKPRVQAPLFPALPPATPLAPVPKFTLPPQFAVPPQFAPTVLAPAGPTRVVCGMTVIEGDAKIDPQMVQHVGLGVGLADPKPIITVVPPSICGR